MDEAAPVSVVIPVRVDTSDRFRNLELVLHFLFTHLDGVELIILEHSAKPACRNLSIQYGAAYHFLETGGCFHKGRLLDFGIGIACHAIVVVHDTDVLVHSSALREAVARVATGRAEFVLPYNGAMVQVRESRLVPSFLPDDDFLASAPFCRVGKPLGDDPDFEYLYGNPDVPSAGGVLVGARRSFVYYGGYNDNIMSYGCEDVELADRLNILGAELQRLKDVNCYHLPHRRGADSHYNNFHASNLQEWQKVRSMSKAALWKYVRSGYRDQVLDTGRRLRVVNDCDEYAVRLESVNLPNSGDIDFVVSFDSRTVKLDLLEALHRRLSEITSGFRLTLVECDGDRAAEAVHHSHTRLVRWRSGEDRDWLSTVLRHADREILVLCAWDDPPDHETVCRAVAVARRDGIATGAVPAYRRDRLLAMARSVRFMSQQALSEATVGDNDTLS